MSSRSTSPKPPSTSSLKAGLNGTKLHPETVFPSDLNLTSDVDWTFDKAVGGPPEQRSAGRCQCRETDDNEAGCLDESCFNFACMEECGPSCQHPNCGNQNISKKKWRPLEICPTPNKGHGLFAIKPIPKRNFIIEYCGEVVGERKLNERFAQYQAKNDRMLYVLELSKGLYIDARSKGGVARFINHSCKPNCTMEKWKVRGNYRMVVFALRDIKKDEELTFDYKWDRRKGRPRTKCYCGVEECRGYLETDTAPVFEEVDGEGKKVGDWRKPTPNETGITLVGQTIKIYFEGNYSYLEAEVDDYNPDMGNYKVRYLCDDEVAEEKLVMKDIFIFDEKITNDIKKRKGRTSLSSKVNVYDGDEDRNETGAIISSKGGVDDRSTNLFISRGCHEFITKKTIIPEMQSKYGVRADQKLTKRSSLNLDDLETITDLNAQMTHFIGITFTGPGNAPTLALDSLKKWIEIFKSQLPPPAPAALPAHNQYEAPSHADVFSPSQTTCYVCCPEASTSTLKMVVDRLQSQSVAVSIFNKQTKVSLHDPTTTLTTFAFLSGSPDMEKWFQEQAYNQFKNDGEHLLFGQEFLESWTQLTQDSTYIQTLSESIAAPVHVTSPAANQPKPMIWYGCNPNDLGLVHNGVISRAVDSLKGSKFVFAPSPVFNPIKDRVLQFLNGQATYVEPWLQITALNNTQQTAEELQSIVNTCLSHQNHLSSKSCAHPFFSSKPSPPPLLSPSDAETMSAELIILGQVCESGGLKGALRRQNIHASTLCGMFWSGGKPLAARILAITSLYMAHKSSSCLLTKPMRLHSLEDVVDVYYQTIYPNNVMDRQGEEMLDICRRVISLETEVADKLGWRLGTAYGDWVWWKILDIEQNGKVKELSQPILNARAVATSGQVGSSDGGRFVAETDGIDLAVAAYAMFQFDDSITKKVSQSLLNGSPSGAAKAFSGILTAVENKKTEKYKDHFRVKSLITSSNKNNPFLSHNHAAAPPTTTMRAYVSGVAMQFHTIASDLNLTAISESVQDGGVTLIGGEKAIYVFVEKINAALNEVRPPESRLALAQVVQIESYNRPSETKNSVLSMPEECRVKPVTSFSVKSLRDSGLFWASSNKTFAEPDYTRNLLSLPQFSNPNNPAPILELASYLKGANEQLANLKLLRVPGRKVSEREEMKLKQMKCRGKVGISPAVLKELQMMEWMEAGNHEGAFVHPQGLVQGRGKTERDEKKKKKKKEEKLEGEEKKSEEEEENLLDVLDFSSDEEDEESPKRNSTIVDHATKTSDEGNSVQPKKKSRKSHAADPDHFCHLVTTDDFAVSMKDFRKVFTRRRAKESKSKSGTDYDPPMAVPLSVVRSILRNLFQIASGCHSIGCALGNNKSAQTYFNFESFLMNESGELKLSSVSACCPLNRSDADFSGLNDIKLKKKGTKDDQKNLKKALEVKFGKDKLLYASPEILLGSQRVTPASDVWAVGALGLQLLLGKATFAIGAGGRTDTLVNITKLAGTISETSNNFGKGKLMPFYKKYEQYIEKKNNKEADKNGGKKKKYKQDMGKGLRVMSKLKGQEYDQFFDFMDSLLKMDPEQRPSAAAALLHPFFSEDSHPNQCSAAARDWLEVRKCFGKGLTSKNDEDNKERGEKRKAENGTGEKGEDKKGRFDEGLSLDDGDDIYGGL